MVHTKYELNYSRHHPQSYLVGTLPMGWRCGLSEIIKINLAKGINYHENGWQAIWERLGFDLWFHNQSMNPSLDMTSFCSRYSLSLIVSRWHAQTWKISNTSYNQHDLLWYCYRWGAVSAIIQNQKNTHKVAFGIREHSSHWFQIVLFVCPGLTASRQSLCCTCTYSFLFMYSCIPMIVTKIMNLSDSNLLPRLCSLNSGQLQAEPMDFQAARALHRRIPAQKWCITKAELEEFAQLVAEEQIPSSRPNPFHCDPKHGPNLYDVNTYLVKPLTRKAGGQSYALMKHPEGLECEVFVSHSWHGGIFHLQKGVRLAWPQLYRLQNLYCCLLSNPQNLDLDEFIGGNLSESAFALALQKASYLLVVPNPSMGVYSRLWCVFWGLSWSQME